MFNTVADDWEVRFKTASATVLPVWSQTAEFEFRSKSADWTGRFTFSGLTLSRGLKLSKYKVAQKAAEVSDRIASMSTDTEQLYWKLQVKQPFCLNDIDWARGMVAFYCVGLFEHASRDSGGEDTVLRFHAASFEKGDLFSHPGFGLPFDSGAFIPNITSTAGIWRIAEA